MKPVYLYITPFFPGPDTWRGAYSLDFVRALTRLSDYDVRVVIPGRGPEVGQLYGSSVCIGQFIQNYGLSFGRNSPHFLFDIHNPFV